MTGGTGGRRKRGELESDVLAVLAAAGEPTTPGGVREALGGGLAYTTVMTALVRLEAKGSVSRSRSGRAYAYELTDQPTRVAHQMRRLLDDGPDRDLVLARFLDSLQPGDVPRLRRLLAGADTQRKDQRR